MTTERNPRSIQPPKETSGPRPRRFNRSREGYARTLQFFQDEAFRRADELRKTGADPFSISPEQTPAHHIGTARNRTHIVSTPELTDLIIE